MNRNQIKEKAISYIREKMSELNGKNVLIGISGGKDSSVVAALCTEALGRDRVFGLLLPKGNQHDLQVAIDLCKYLNIRYDIVDIEPIIQAYNGAFRSVSFIDSIKDQTSLNLPPRIRMSILYGVSQSMDSTFVVNTSNLSEDWVGYATLYGDTTGAFSPLAYMTTEEVINLGIDLGLPEKFVLKKPEDGLTGKTDEDVFGFSYSQLNRYIRTGEIEDEHIKEKIDKMHRNSRFKFLPIDMLKLDLPIKADDIAGIYKKDEE